MSHAPRLSRTLLALSVGAVLLSPGLAFGDSPQQQGWWTATNPGALVPMGGQGSADVPADGLLVQPGPQAPTAYAALLYPLPTGALPDTLTLAAAPGSATPPEAKLAVCPLVEPQFEQAQGGPMTDAPAYDCSRTLVATLDAASSTFTFELSDLALRGTVGLALVPGDTTSRVVLAKPGEESLTTVDGLSTGRGTSTPASGLDGGTASSGDAGVTSAPALNTGGLATPRLPAAPPALASAEEPALAPPAAEKETVPAVGATQVAQTALVTSEGGEGIRRFLTGLIAIGVSLAVLLWAFVGGSPTSASSSTASSDASGAQPG